MGESFLQRVDKEILVMSGAMGTMLHKEGARIVSACCGSSPLHLKAIVKKVREFIPKK